MKVYKFGGASINSYERIKNLSWILQHHKEEKILIVISAMGKMTNALERVAEEYFEGKKEEALLLFQSVKSHHLNFLKYLLTFGWERATYDLEIIFKSGYSGFIGIEYEGKNPNEEKGVLATKELLDKCIQEQMIHY